MDTDVTVERRIRKTVTKYVTSDIRKSTQGHLMHELNKHTIRVNMCQFPCNKRNTMIHNG